MNEKWMSCFNISCFLQDDHKAQLTAFAEILLPFMVKTIWAVSPGSHYWPLSNWGFLVKIFLRSWVAPESRKEYSKCDQAAFPSNLRNWSKYPVDPLLLEHQPPHRTFSFRQVLPWSPHAQPQSRRPGSWRQQAGIPHRQPAASCTPPQVLDKQEVPGPQARCLTQAPLRSGWIRGSSRPPQEPWALLDCYMREADDVVLRPRGRKFCCRSEHVLEEFVSFIKLLGRLLQGLLHTVLVKDPILFTHNITA